MILFFVDLYIFVRKVNFHSWKVNLWWQLSRGKLKIKKILEHRQYVLTVTSIMGTSFASYQMLLCIILPYNSAQISEVGRTNLNRKVLSHTIYFFLSFIKRLHNLAWQYFWIEIARCFCACPLVCLVNLLLNVGRLHFNYACNRKHKDFIKLLSLFISTNIHYFFYRTCSIMNI